MGVFVFNFPRIQEESLHEMSNPIFWEIHYCLDTTLPKSIL